MLLAPKLRPNFAQTNVQNIEDSILEIIKQNNQITQVEIANLLNVSRDVVKRNIKKLKESKKLERKSGTRNGGYWEVL